MDSRILARTTSEKRALALQNGGIVVKTRFRKCRRHKSWVLLSWKQELDHVGGWEMITIWARVRKNTNDYSTSKYGIFELLESLLFDNYVPLQKVDFLNVCSIITCTLCFKFSEYLFDNTWKRGYSVVGVVKSTEYRLFKTRDALFLPVKVR